MRLNYTLLTKYADSPLPEVPLSDYPRPQLCRSSYMNLNGLWDCVITADGKCTYSGPITVPFSPESILSGVRNTDGSLSFDPASNILIEYSREITLTQDFMNDVILLHVDAADQVSKIYINGCPVGEHTGGYLPAVYNIAEYVHEGINAIRISVQDNLSLDLPTGKQAKERHGIWYTPISGIWQSVWLESASSGYIKDLQITPDIDQACVNIKIDSCADCFEVELYSPRSLQIGTYKVDGKELTIKLSDALLWSPEEPNLYSFIVRAFQGETLCDEVSSYFAMRKFSVNETCFLLNNKPYFVAGLLDQGYFSDGIYTPASYDAFEGDILAMKSLGFNTLRKHIKIEPLRFYYLCDKLGMLVFQDTVNIGQYKVFRDTLRPALGLRRAPRISLSEQQQQTFREESAGLIKHLYNSPSVVAYTIFNEGWGQFDADANYKRLKELDPSRVFDATSGWFWGELSDVISEHIYFKAVKLKKYKWSRPVFLSEFGGYACKLPEHSFNLEKTFGYKKCEGLEAFEHDFIELFERDVLGNIPKGLAGIIYTQVSDVEDETNGLMTYDRRVLKLNAEKIRPLIERIKAAL